VIAWVDISVYMGGIFYVCMAVCGWHGFNLCGYSGQHGWYGSQIVYSVACTFLFLKNMLYVAHCFSVAGNLFHLHFRSPWTLICAFGLPR
jgi:hypothetical protein